MKKRDLKYCDDDFIPKILMTLIFQAQSLHGPITGASKIAYTDHHLYVMKDSEANK